MNLDYPFGLDFVISLSLSGPVHPSRKTKAFHMLLNIIHHVSRGLELWSFPLLWLLQQLLRAVKMTDIREADLYKSSAVAEMSDRLATIDMG